MGQFILNGRNYSGLTYAQGLFIDTDNVIKSRTQFYGSMNYTATEDCYVGIYIVGVAGNGVSILINNQLITSFYYNATLGDGILYPLKKGQTLSVSGVTTQYESNYIVYGIQEGSPVTFLSEYASACYDTTEREVGCWIDGKPLYQITRAYNNIGGTTVRVNVADLNIDRVVETKLSSKNTPSNQIGSGYYINSGDFLRVYLDTSTNELVFDRGTYHAMTSDGFVTVCYTKTTDVAGSGKLTPTAMPTVHYDTNEQVIGTFLGKTLYQRTWDFSATGILVSYNAWTDTSIDSTNMENIVSVKATHPDGTCYEGIMADPTRQSHTIVGLQTTRNGNDARLQYVTIQYTKTT